MSEVETGSCHGFIEWLFVGLGTILIVISEISIGDLLLIGFLIVACLWLGMMIVFYYSVEEAIVQNISNLINFIFRRKK